MVMRMIAAAALVLALAMPLQAQVQGQVKARALPDPQAQAQAEAQTSLDRVARARENLAALQDGRRAVADLAPQELQDVIVLERQVRAGQADTRSVRQRCIDEEVRREGGTPSSLAWEVIRLKCRD
jgi:hypothetical protein